MTPQLDIDPDDYLLIERTAARATLFWEGVSRALIVQSQREAFIRAATPAEEADNKDIALNIFKTVQRGKHTDPADQDRVDHLQAESHLYHMRLTNNFTRIAQRVLPQEILQACLPSDILNGKSGFLLQKYKLDALYGLVAPKIPG
jgi:hypothetical protein